MPIDVAIAANMPLEQAKALLEATRSQYMLQFNEHWYDDRFRSVPEWRRHEQLLKAFPAMAAQKRLIGALLQGMSGAR